MTRVVVYYFVFRTIPAFPTTRKRSTMISRLSFVLQTLMFSPQALLLFCIIIAVFHDLASHLSCTALT